MGKLLGIFVISLGATIMRKKYVSWRKAKFMQEMSTILTVDGWRYLTKADVMHIFASLTKKYQVEKYQIPYYREVINHFAKAYEEQAKGYDTEQKYTDLAKLHEIFQIDIDNQYQQRVFATLFMKIRNN